MIQTNLNTTNPYITKKQQPVCAQPLKPAFSGKDSVSFKGHIGASKADKSAANDSASKQISWLRHETALFRDTETNNFVQDYTLKNFGSKDKIKIVVGACSSGEEAVTQSMLLNDIKDKVDILAFDLSKQSIDEAKSRKYLFQKPQPAPDGYHDTATFNYNAFNDAYVWSDSTEELTEEQKDHKKLFEEFFEPTGETVAPQKKSFSLKYKEWLVKKMFKIWPLTLEGKYFKLKDNMADNINFVQGDILNVKDVMKGDKADVFFFRNAMYHLIAEDVGNGLLRRLKPDAEETIRKIGKQIKENMNENGIFVLGQEEWLQTMDTETVPRVLKELGFKPVFETKDGFTTVWQV